MWILDDRNKSLQAKTSANYTTTPVSFSCIYATYHSDNQTPHSEYGNLTNSYEDIVRPPAQNTSKELKSIRVYNSDSIAHTITFILKNKNSTQESEITIYKTTLSAGWTIEYIKERGWNTYNNQGQPVVIQTTSLAASLNDSYIFVGDATNVAVGVPVTGDLSLVNTGAFTVNAIQGYSVTMGGTLTTTGNITMVGAFNYTFNVTGNTNVTFPISGTLATLAGAETFTNKISYNGLIVTPNTGVITAGTWNATNIGLAYGGTNTDLSATGGAGQVLMQTSVGGNITVGLLSASSISGGTALNKVDDTNVTLTLTGNPLVALLATTTLTLGWTGTLADGRIASAATWNAKVDSVTGTSNRITISGTAVAPVVDIAATYVGQASITTLGTIATGTWQGTSISTTYTDAKIKTVTGTLNRITIGGTATDPTFDISTSYVGQNTITTLGTIVTGVWNGTVVANAYIATALSGKTYEGLTITTSTGTLTIANGKVITQSNTLTYTGTDGSTVAFGGGGTVVYTSNNLSVHAATTSAQLAGVLSDEVGTGFFVLNDSPIFTTNITTPIILGGSAVGSTLTLQGTSGNGTSSVAAVNINVGNNGATIALKAFNSGQVDLTSIGTNGISFQGLVGTTTTSAIYLNQSTPSATNYTLWGTAAGQTVLNGPSDINIRINDGNRIVIGTVGISLSTGNGVAGTSQYSITHSNNSNQTAGSNTPKETYTLGTMSWATGAVAQADFVQWTQPSALAAGASTFTLANTIAINGAVIASTNATLTASTALYIGAGSALNAVGTVTTGYGIYANAPTGATTNWAIYSAGGTLLGVSGSDHKVQMNLGTSTTLITFMGRVGATTNAAMYLGVGSGSESNTNYALSYDGTLRINAQTTTTTINLLCGNTGVFAVTPGNSVSTAFFSFVPRARTSLTTLTNVPIWDFGSGNSIQTWAAGTVPLQYMTWFRSQTMAFASASTTTFIASMTVDYTTRGTNATFGTSVGIYVPTLAYTSTTTAAGLYIEPPTGATNNWSAIFTGNLNFSTNASKIEATGTGANGLVLKNLKNSANTTVSGTVKTVEIDIAGTPYYFLVSPTSSA